MRLPARLYECREVLVRRGDVENVRAHAGGWIGLLYLHLIVANVHVTPRCGVALPIADREERLSLEGALGLTALVETPALDEGPEADVRRDLVCSTHEREREEKESPRERERDSERPSEWQPHV